MKLKTLTIQQKESLKEKRDFYISKFLNNEKINRDAAIEAITFCYSLIKKPCPQIFKVVSPMQAQRLANKMNKTERKFYQFGTFLTVRWASFYAYYNTFVDFGIITEDRFPKYFKLRKFIDSNIFMTIEFEKAIIVCEKPIFIKRDDRGMHCLDGPAIQWEDGYGQYYIHGRHISKRYFYSILNKSFSVEDLFAEKNEEVKSACLQMITDAHGENYLAIFLGSVLKEVDTFVDKKQDKYLQGTTKGMNVGVYTLFKGSIQGYDIGYIRCYCPSTDRMFYLGVETKYNNAKDAIASLYSIPSKLKPFIKSISRQGERFSTTFTDEGLLLLKQLKEPDLKNLSSISGEEYFKKIQYEF